MKFTIIVYQSKPKFFNGNIYKDIALVETNCKNLPLKTKPNNPNVLKIIKVWENIAMGKAYRETLKIAQLRAEMLNCYAVADEILLRK